MEEVLIPDERHLGTHEKEEIMKVGGLATILPILFPATAILVAIVILRPMLREGLFVDPS